MRSGYLERLDPKQRLDLEAKLLESQDGRCFICREPIDPSVHLRAVEIDHVEPLAFGGRDAPENFAVTHINCNRLKLASDLRIARLLVEFERIKKRCDNAGPNRPNLSDVLEEYGGARHELGMKVEDGAVRYGFAEVGDDKIYSSPLLEDELSGIKCLFAKLPIEYLFHDERINPRAIGGNLRSLLEEFFRGRPQLHVALAWAEIKGDSSKTRVHVFDGQHKAAALVLLGVRRLPVRILLNPDLDLLLTTNTNAGTSLRQVAFDKSVQRYLGSELYRERITRYQKARGKDEEYFDFSERDLVNFFRGESREIRRYILDDVRAAVVHHPDNRLRDFIDFGGRGKEKPLSYSSIEKTFFSLFLCQDTLETKLGDKLDFGENPRQLEKEQFVRLFNIIADEVYLGKFDPAIGVSRLERKIVDGEDRDITDPHLRAFRMSKEEILYNWLKLVNQVIKRYFLIQGKPIRETALLHYKLPEPLWESIRRVVNNLARLPIWVNRELARSVFGGKQPYGYWEHVFQTGRSPDGVQILARGLDLDELLKGD